MKAWHVQDINGDNQEIIFAEKRSLAISKSEARGWNDYIDVRAKRAKYCDDLEKEPNEIIQAQLDNGWWMECHDDRCAKQITIDDEHTIVDGKIYCEICSKN
ncbi:hypothetical protein MKX53_17560 [Psychrobacillus sp. FSL K6-4615]|uniref:hypothetical protein n=1 Tax=Psychrobacillus sp. FSL K6-4615 TaxID=2921551 RepID=UPI0030FADF8D